MDTTLVSLIRGDGSARPGAADFDGIALAQARRKKERTYPKLVGPPDPVLVSWSWLGKVKGITDVPSPSGTGQSTIRTAHLLEES